MEKNYFLSVFFMLVFLFCTQNGISQNYATNTPAKNNIEGLSIYPNPVKSSHTFIYISSKKNLTKHVEFFNVIGKLIYKTKLIGKELNIAKIKQRRIYFKNI